MWLITEDHDYLLLLQRKFYRHNFLTQHILKWEFMCSLSNSAEVYAWWSISQYLVSLVQLIVWCWIGHMPFPEPLNWSWSTSLMKIDLHYLASMIKPWIPHTLCNANSLLCLKLVFIVTIFNPSVHSRGKRYLINDFCDHTTGGKAPMS